MSAHGSPGVGPGTGGPPASSTPAARARLKSPSPDPDTALREAAVRFEAVFVQQMLAAMRATIPEGGAIDGGQAEDLFAGMLDMHLAEHVADRTGRGLAEAIYRQLSRGSGR